MSTPVKRDSGSIRSWHFLGIQVHEFTKAELLDALIRQVRCGEPGATVGNHNLHSLYLVGRTPKMAQFYATNLYTHIDGMSLILLGRVFGAQLRRAHRHGYSDWLRDLFEAAAENQWRVFFVGAPENMTAQIVDSVRHAFPSLQFVAHNGYDVFREDTTVWHEIEEFKPQIVLVGMSMPLQEQWILVARERGVQPQLYLPCGAALEFIAGAQKEAPRWMGQVGLEWFYRLVSNPGKFYRRYLIEPLAIMPFLVREYFRPGSVQLREAAGHLKSHHRDVPDPPP